jgi:hypothetical protein
MFTIILIDTIACKYNFTNKTINDFFIQICQNNNRDIISIMYLLLPYIEDKNDYELYKKIVKLEDITCLKKNSLDESDNNYTICNYQFSRSIDLNISPEYKNFLEENDILKKTSKYYYEYKYSLYDLEMSFKIVLRTIDQISSKLYVNWINVIPITVEDYKTSSKYINSFYYDVPTKKLLYKDVFSGSIEDFDFWNLDLDSNLRQYGGITADDLFNTIYKFLFDEIYNSGVKWLLYEKQTDLKTRPKIYLELINDLIDITNLYNNNIYDIININTRKQTEIKWLKILSNAYSDPTSIDGDFIKCLIIKFDQKFCDEEIGEKYDYDYTTLYDLLKKSSSKLNDLEDEDVFLDLNLLNMGGELYDDYLKKIGDIRKIPFEQIYNFLKEQIEKFKLTWYGKQILIKEKDKIIINTKPKLSDQEAVEIDEATNKYFITFKNIYNFAKYISLIFKNKKDGVMIFDSRCLDFANKQKFIDIINSTASGVSKFNIKNVLKKTYIQITDKTINLLQKNITEYFFTNLKDLVFLTYILLTTFFFYLISKLYLAFIPFRF